MLFGWKEATPVPLPFLSLHSLSIEGDLGVQIYEILKIS